MVFQKRTSLFLFALSFLVTSCSQQYEFGVPESSDNFGSSILRNNKVDIIFIVDDSGTMVQPQAALKNSIPGMVQALLNLKMDLHIAVISTSMGGTGYRGGRFVGSPTVLTNGTPNLAGVLGQRLQMGTDGRDREAGLQSLVTVLSPSYLNGEGRGFLRDDAMLAIMALTNEDDKSALSLTETDVQYTTKFLDNLKKPFDTGSRSWTVNLIGVLDTTANCPTNPMWNYTEMSQKYIDLANISNGTIESICAADLTNAVSNIKSRIVQVMTDYKLTREPDVSTIRVYSAGRPVPRSNVNGWDYLPSLQVVRLYGSWIPASDVEIRVDFLPAHAD